MYVFYCNSATIARDSELAFLSIYSIQSPPSPTCAKPPLCRLFTSLSCLYSL